MDRFPVKLRLLGRRFRRRSEGSLVPLFALALVPLVALVGAAVDYSRATIMATIQRINIIGSREGSRNRRRLKANQTGKKCRVGIKSNISTNRNNLISGVDRCIHLNAMKKTPISSITRQTIKI